MEAHQITYKGQNDKHFVQKFFDAVVEWVSSTNVILLLKFRFDIRIPDQSINIITTYPPYALYHNFINLSLILIGN